ncbi:gustatory receptor 68a isoform X1 [Halyomorpha halys]|uniref:gustatory receptor 68a isoform X1 n=1 Tax=Halyomorpha halys TaxID=286706 RepID=UPI0006D510B7|nr:gustatory receptor 68a-like [Halyomorpha halys]KAE8573692.1 Gustatory receptor 84 [Halyomorpha halys]
MMKPDVKRCLGILMGPAKMLGLFPIAWDERRCYRISVPFIAISSLKCLAYTVVTIVYLSVNFTASENIALGAEIDYISLILINAIPILSVCELVCTLHEFNECIFFLEAAELQLLQLGKFVDYDTSKRPLWINALLALGAFFARFAKNAIIDPAAVLLSGLQVLVTFSLISHMIVLVYWYFGVVGILTKLFAACNQEVRNYVRDFVVLKMRKVEKLARAHHTLCLCTTTLNDIHGAQLVAIFLSCFVLSVTEVYRCIIFLEEKVDVTFFLVIAVKLCCIILCFNLCLQIVTACKECSAEAKEFHTLLYQLMLDDKTNDLSNNKKLCLHIAMKREVVFTACGFFKLDYTLVHSMIAAATTYLVILIQFGQPRSMPTLPTNSLKSSEYTNATSPSTRII